MVSMEGGKGSLWGRDICSVEKDGWGRRMVG